MTEDGSNPTPASVLPASGSGYSSASLGLLKAFLAKIGSFCRVSLVAAVLGALRQLFLGQDLPPAAI